MHDRTNQRLLANPRAATLVEMMQQPELRLGATGLDRTALAELLARWRAILDPLADPKGLQRRLDWLGVDEKSLLDRLDAARPEISMCAPADATAGLSGESGRSPALLDLLNTIRAYFAKDATTHAALGKLRSGLKPGPPLPFEDLLAPTMLSGYRQLRLRLGNSEGTSPGFASPGIGRQGLASTHIAEQAFSGLTYQLLQQVCHLSQWVLFDELRQRRPAMANLILDNSGGPLESSEREFYIDLTQDLGRSGLEPLLANYPVLERLIENCLSDWLDASALFILNIEEDWPRLEQFSKTLRGETSSACEPTEVIAIEAGLGDRHNGGRTVTRVTFNTGLELIYKPRDLSLDLAAEAFFAWCNATLGTRLRAPQCLALSDHGWVEKITPSPLPAASTAADFYRNAGELLFVMFLLGGTDGHNENVIAAGDRLVPIDLETLLSPDFQLLNERERPAGLDIGAMKIFDTVLSTGLLPRWEHNPKNDFVSEASGLGTSFAPQDGICGFSKMDWRAINSDDMHRGIVEHPLQIFPSEPSRASGRISSIEHVEDIVAGFENAYRMAVCQRDMLLHPSLSPLQAFDGVASRFVFRATAVYLRILEQALQPENLRTGGAWGLCFENLARAHARGEDNPPMWQVVACEIEHLQQGDIPYFSINTTDATIQLGDGVWQPDPELVEPGLAGVRTRLVRLNPDHMRQQSLLIRKCFHARDYHDRTRSGATGVHLDTSSDIELLSADQLTEQAELAAQTLQRHALRLEDGVRWLAFKPLGMSKRIQLEHVDFGLYDGACGIALFLAAIDHVSGTDRYRSLWVNALRPLRRASEIEAARPSLRTGAVDISIGQGVAGIIYSVSVLLRLSPSGEHDWLNLVANVACDKIHSESVASDTALDIIGGSAGAILALLALQQVTGEASLLEKARICGDHLVARLRPVLAGDAGATGDKPLLTGLSHGASGFAMALGRLGYQCGQADYQETALALLDYERAHFDSKAENWPDLRFSPRHFMSSWCHGAPGIALARLELMRLGGSGDPTVLSRAFDQLNREFEQAIATTMATSDNGLDHLCCGQFGLCDILWQAGWKLNRPELRLAAERRLAHTVQAARRGGGYRLVPGAHQHIVNPGIFQGVAGIGYQLLRMKNRSELPSIIDFD